jgi:hypothetical protein
MILEGAMVVHGDCDCSLVLGEKIKKAGQFAG